MKKDIQGLRKEIVERDDTIQDKVSLLQIYFLSNVLNENVDTCVLWNTYMYLLKWANIWNFCTLQEKRIYDLKKKNQELEKFKFVLDYKIKELKKQIEPRENDIKQMKDQIQEVRLFNNAAPHNLGTIVM